MAEDPEINDDEMAHVRTEVDEMIADYGDDLAYLIKDTEKGIETNTLDPQDPPFWRAVVRELRRRAEGQS